MNNISVFISFILLSYSLNANNKNSINQKQTVDFNPIIKYFQENTFFENAVELPLIYKGVDYNISISNNPILLDIKEINLGTAEKNYPICYSIIYNDKLVSLFDKGRFICYSLATIERDLNFEKCLNTKKIEYIWYIDNKLIGISKNKYYYLSSDNKWIKYSELIPIKNQPKLFEDSSFICFNDCNGEWGGTVYFYNKKTNEVHFTEASCANSILKREDKYFMLSHLGHMSGISDLKEISNPDKLLEVNLKNINTKGNREVLGYLDNSKVEKNIFDYYGIQFFSSFIYQNRTLYIAYWEGMTFLTEIKNNTIEIVNPLLNKEIYTHEPITNLYGETILVNLNHYGTAKEKEVSCIIIKNNQFIKINWN